MMLLSTGNNETMMNESAVGWDDADSLWQGQTPFDVVWYSVLFIILYSVVFTACVVGKFVSLLPLSFFISFTSLLLPQPVVDSDFSPLFRRVQP